MLISILISPIMHSNITSSFIKKKLKLKEMKWPTGGHIAREWQSQNSKPDLWDSAAQQRPLSITPLRAGDKDMVTRSSAGKGQTALQTSASFSSPVPAVYTTNFIWGAPSFTYTPSALSQFFQGRSFLKATDSAVSMCNGDSWKGLGRALKGCACVGK